MKEMKPNLLAKDMCQQEQTTTTLVRNYKDSVFRLLFNDKERAPPLSCCITAQRTAPTGSRCSFQTASAAKEKTIYN